MMLGTACTSFYIACPGRDQLEIAIHRINLYPVEVSENCVISQLYSGFFRGVSTFPHRKSAIKKLREATMVLAVVVFQ